MDDRKVAVFRSALLPYSETFITGQGESVPGYVSTYVGLRAVDGTFVPSDRTVICSSGQKRTGRLALACGYNTEMLEILRSRAFSLVHSHFGQDAALMRASATRVALPHVVTFHGFDVFPDTKKRSGKLDRFWVNTRHKVFSEARLLVAVSNTVRDRLLELGAPAEKVVVHYIGIDTDLFVPPIEVPVRPRVLFVGRLVPQKGVTDFLLMAEKVQRAIPDALFTVVGDGPLRAPAQRRCEEKRLNVEFAGGLQHGEVLHRMQQATVFCVPSRMTAEGRREALGLVFVEAASCGVPVVAYDSGGVSEAVSRGRSAFLHDEGDSEGLADSVVRIVEDQALRSQMGRDGRSFVVGNHNRKRQSEVLAALYDDVAVR